MPSCTSQAGFFSKISVFTSELRRAQKWENIGGPLGFAEQQDRRTPPAAASSAEAGPSHVNAAVRSPKALKSAKRPVAFRFCGALGVEGGGDASRSPDLGHRTCFDFHLPGLLGLLYTQHKAALTHSCARIFATPPSVRSSPVLVHPWKSEALDLLLRRSGETGLGAKAGGLHLPKDEVLATCSTSRLQVRDTCSFICCL